MRNGFIGIALVYLLNSFNSFADDCILLNSLANSEAEGKFCCQVDGDVARLCTENFLDEQCRIKGTAGVVKRCSLTAADEPISQAAANLSVIKLETFSGDDAYERYAQLAETINHEIREAKKRSSEYARLATESFLAGFHALKARYAKAEMEEYPLVSMNGFNFRILKPIKMTPKDGVSYFSPMDPFKAIRQVMLKRDRLLFFKVIPEKHLCSIKRVGLDSKWGGVGGASETIAGFKSLTWKYDRGRMFLNYGYLTNDYDAGFKHNNIAVIGLGIAIPADQTKNLNLTIGDQHGSEWFIAGTTLVPEWINVLTPDNKSIPISEYPCD